MKTLGIINFEGSNVKVEGLQDHRPVPAFSFLGRYRLIDVMISNMTNSGIDWIMVYMNDETRSLLEHLGTGRHYNINSKTGRLQVLAQDSKISGIYNHDVNAFLHNMEAIEDVDADYVVIGPSYIVYPIDFRKAIKAHEESEADITVIYKPVKDADQRYFECDCLTLDNEENVLDISLNEGKYKNRFMSLETYIMKKELFINLIHLAQMTSSVYWLADIISDNLDNLKVKAYRCLKDCFFICNFNDYYWANITIKNNKVAKELFNKDWPIYTRTSDTAPAYYGGKAKVKNSVVSNGTIIKGTVENSVIGRQVTIEEGAVVKDSIVLAGSYIGKGVKMSYTVVDKKAKINSVKSLAGKPNGILYVKRKDRI